MKKLLITILILLTSGSYAFSQGNDPIPEAPFGLSPVEVLSIFNGNFQNRDYQSALNFGRWLILAHPKEMELPGGARYRADRTITRMITVYEEIAKTHSDPVLKEAYIDSAKGLYLMALDIFDKDEIDHYMWRFNYGRFLQTNREISNNDALAVEQYLELYSMDPRRLVTEANGYYIQFIVDFTVRSGDRDRAIALMEEAEPLAGPETLNFFATVRDRLFSNPAERIEYLLTLGDDLQILQELFELYTRVGDRDNIRRMAGVLYERDPNYENIMRMADMAANDANYREAIRFLEEAIERTDDNLKKREATLRIADNYLNMDNLQRARDFARRASALDPSWGLPYLRMADIYAQAVSRCAGSAITREDKIVYYLVLDMLDRARTVDASTANTVQRQYRTYSNVLPSAEEKFFMNWNPGDRIRVDGSLKECYAWINESTTIR
jgi:tetratricopeptide (TPR) repeat protein